ncbi:MAG: glycosyltransferase family 39 protein, partial [Bryobacteraceae bacterium]
MKPSGACSPNYEKKDSDLTPSASLSRSDRTGFTTGDAIVLAVAAVIFLGCIISPPSLMDDVDAVQAQIARNMLESGDWVTARLDGVVYLEKPPLKYWMIATSYLFFGVHDWAARLPIALGIVLLCWVTYRFGRWAFGAAGGLYSGLVLSTCVGLFLFTRVLIADSLVTLAVCTSMWSLLRVLDEEERRPRLWAFLLAASIGAGIMLKGLIAVVFPVGAGCVYLLLTRQLFSLRTWKRLRPFSGLAVVALIAAPWHILAILRNPPYFDLTMHSGPGTWRGFFWLYFLNEHVFRFLNMRYPRDYNTVPRHLFWLLHLVWLFPWSMYLPATLKLSYKPIDRVGRTRFLALCWIGFVLAFFAFSTTQEYYSMPAYPAFALLLGSAMAAGGAWIRIGCRVTAVISAAATLVIVALLYAVRNIPVSGDISAALAPSSDVYAVYTLSLGHMGDLTIRSFAYLKLPLAMAGLAFLIGAFCAWRWEGKRAFLSLALMMVLFTHAARLAMVVFDPYLSSRPLAEALRKAPRGTLVVDDQYYAFSSVFFYADRNGLLLNGRVTNLEYGSYAPGAPNVFIDDRGFVDRWKSAKRYYLVAARTALPRIEAVAGRPALHILAESGGKLLLTNKPA